MKIAVCKSHVADGICVDNDRECNFWVTRSSIVDGFRLLPLNPPPKTIPTPCPLRKE
jgi:hypothetical protein